MFRFYNIHYHFLIQGAGEAAGGLLVISTRFSFALRLLNYFFRFDD